MAMEYKDHSFLSILKKLIVTQNVYNKTKIKEIKIIEIIKKFKMSI